MRRTVLLALTLCALTFPASAFQNDPLQGRHQDMLSDMETFEPSLQAPVEALWRATLLRNATLQLALQKLAEKGGQMPAKNKKAWTTKMLQSAIQLGGMGGAMFTGSPAPLIGSSMIGRMTAPDTLPKRLAAVSSAELVIMAREIEQAQNKLLLDTISFKQAQEEKRRLEADRLEIEAQARAMHAPEAVIKSVLAEQALKIRQADSTLATVRQMLALSAGEDAVNEAETLMNNPPKPSTDKDAPQ